MPAGTRPKNLGIHQGLGGGIETTTGSDKLSMVCLSIASINVLTITLWRLIRFRRNQRGFLPPDAVKNPVSFWPSAPSHRCGNPIPT